MVDIVNPSFETGDLTGWTPPSGVVTTVGTGFGVTNGTYSCAFGAGTPGIVDLLQTAEADCWEGKSITASCDYSQGSADSGRNTGQVVLRWYDAGGNYISENLGNLIRSSSGNKTTTVTAPAPAGTAGVRVGLRLNKNRNNGCAVDNFRWNFTSTATVDLLYPLDGSTYGAGDTVPYRVEVTTSDPITSVTYKATDTTTAVTTVVGTSTTAPYNVDSSVLPAGEYSVVAEAVIGGSVTFTSDPHILTIGTPPPPETREYKASNSYTYLVAEDFSGLSAQMPPTANVVGMETIIDYSIQVLARVKDKDIDPAASQYWPVFTMAPSVTWETVLLEGGSGNYSVLGGSNTGQQAVLPSDFTVTESGTSEGKRWVVLQGLPQQITVGGEAQLFGMGFIPSSSFVEDALGVRFYPNLGSKPATADSGDACFRVKIDKLRVRIYFDAGSVEYYFKDVNGELKAELVAAYADSGKFENGDASGFMQIADNIEVISGQGPAIRDGMTIHSGTPATAQNQIGVVSGPMSYNGLSTYWTVEDSRSRYEFITANFYGDLTYDSIYGVNGNDRAFAYNGDWFYKIHAQPDAVKDKPRHVEFYHTHLALGYGEGRVDISVVGEPYNFSGLDGASSWAIGDSVTGLLNLSGTMLGIFGNKSITGLSGTTVDNFATQVLSPKIGAIEYTITDMGFPVYANAYGVYTLAQTAQYGDYLGSPMSQDISPYIRPRLIRKNTSDKEVVVAWPVRSKNQYKLAFADGDVITMTLNGGQQGVPTFSRQQYSTQEEPVVPSPPSAPVLQAPSEAEPGASYDVTWAAVSGADYYIVERSVDEPPSYVTVYEGTETQVSLVATSGPEPMVHRARACNADGCSVYSQTVSTTIIPVVTAGDVTITSPYADVLHGDGLTVSGASVEFRAWRDAFLAANPAAIVSISNNPDVSLSTWRFWISWNTGDSTSVIVLNHGGLQSPPNNYNGPAYAQAYVHPPGGVSSLYSGNVTVSLDPP